MKNNHSLSSLREQLGKSRTNIASDCGVNAVSVRKWEEGKNIKLDHAFRAVAAYGLQSLDEFYEIWSGIRT